MHHFTHKKPRWSDRVGPHTHLTKIDDHFSRGRVQLSFFVPTPFTLSDIRHVLNRSPFYLDFEMLAINPSFCTSIPLCVESTRVERWYSSTTWNSNFSPPSHICSRMHRNIRPSSHGFKVACKPFMGARYDRWVREDQSIWNVSSIGSSGSSI